MSAGKEFQTDGAATEKARRANVSITYLGQAYTENISTEPLS